MNNILNKLKKILSEYWFVIIFTIIFALLFYYNGLFGISPLQDGDNFIFRNAAYFMKRGLVMYKDFIDNKGPYLYFINYLFLIFDDLHVIFYVTLLLGIITNVYIYKIARLKLNSFYSNLVMVLTNGLLIVYMKQFSGGITNNMVEFYAMPIFAYTYYKYLENKELTRFNIVVLGFLCGILLNLRVNLASISVICSFFTLFNYLKKKEFKNIIKYIAYYTLGVIISYIPIIIYFVRAGSIMYYINSYILFNSKYSVSLTEKYLVVDSVILSHLIKGFMIILYFSFNIYSIIVLIIYLIRIFKYKKDIDNAIIYVFCFLVATLISARYYYHYVWIIVPLISYPLSILFELIDFKKFYKIACYVVVGLSIIIFSINIIKAISIKLDEEYDNEEYEQMMHYLNNNAYDENDKILFMINIVNDCYIDSNMLPAGDYIFQYWFNSDMYYYSSESFKKNRPKYVVSGTKKQGVEWTEFMQKELHDNYIKKYDNEIYEVYELR